MGCHLPKSNNTNTSKAPQSQKNGKFEFSVVLPKINYEYVQIFKELEIEYAHIFVINKQSFIILIQPFGNKRVSIYNVESNEEIICDLDDVEDVKGVVTNQNYLFLQTRQYLFKLCLANQKLVLKQKYLNIRKNFNVEILFINEKQDLILEQRKRVIRLKSLNLQKQIFQIQQKEQSKMTYHKNKGFIIYLEEANVGYELITIFCLMTRQVIIQQHQEKVMQMVLVQNSDDILIQIFQQGLFLYRVFYEDKKIEKIKLLNYNTEQICLFDYNNLLNLITQMFFIRFDNQYNIIQKFRINYNYDINTICYEKLLLSLNSVQIKQNLPELFSFNTYNSKPTYLVYKLEKKNSDKQGEDLTFSLRQNYQMDYIYYSGRVQHLISPDQRYITCIIGSSLMFHVIQKPLDKYISFENKINYLSFNEKSNYLYVALDHRINCYKSQQNLKQCSQFHYQVDKLQTCQGGFGIAINNQSQVIAYSKYNKKLIFKLSTMKYKSFDYQSDGIILVASNDEIRLYNLVDRKLIANHMIRNKQCKLIQNTQSLLKLNDDEQLQLWSYKDGYLILEKIIMDKVRIILQGYLGFQCLRKLNQIIIIDHNFKIVEEIAYETFMRDQGPQFDSDAVNDDDQILQRNFIIRLSIYQSVDIYYGGNQENFILSLEQR